MTLEQLERRIRALELSTRGFDYVAEQDAIDATEDAIADAIAKAKADTTVDASEEQS